MKADLILKNADIWTVDQRKPHAQALAIHQSNIIAMGSNEEIEVLAAPFTSVFDLGGRLVLPGFNDCHTHFITAALRSATNLDLYGVSTMEEVQARLRLFAIEHPNYDWFYGMRWFPTRINQGVWPTRADLDAIESIHPVVIFDIDGHTCWTNTAAIQRKGYTTETPDPEGGQILRDSSGYPTGVFFENAQEAFERYPPVSKDEFPALFKKEVAKLNRLGITSLSNNGVKPEHLDAIDTMATQDALYIRINEWPFLLDGLDKAIGWRNRFANNEKIRVGTLKIMFDGVMSNYSAWMLEPYADNPSETGYPLIEPEKLLPMVVAADQAGFQVAAHVIGTRAIHTMLDIYEQAQQQNGKRDSRHRLEHVEASQPDDRRRFAELGVIASMTPVHCTADLEGYYISRLGEKGHYGFAWRSFLDHGVHLSFGTDWPAVDLKEPSPLEQIFAAVTRCTPQNYGRLKWHLEQQITIQEAIRSYTLESAYAERMDHRKGSLTPGKLADMIILSENILDIPPEKLLETEVLMTIFDGKIVFRTDSF